MPFFAVRGATHATTFPLASRPATQLGKTLLTLSGVMWKLAGSCAV